MDEAPALASGGWKTAQGIARTDEPSAPVSAAADAQRLAATLDRSSRIFPGGLGREAESLDTRILVLLRCALAAAALGLFWVAPIEIGRHAPLAYGLLAAYAAYSIGIALFSYERDWRALPPTLHWVDIAFYGFLLGLSDGPTLIFFLFFLYSVLNASLSAGFRQGLLGMAAALALYAAHGILFWQAGRGGGLAEAGMQALCLLVFGYAIVYLGGYERQLRRRLALLKEVNDLWSPRFGVDHVYGVNLERLREFYHGNSCVLVLRRPSPSPHYVMYSALQGKPGRAATPSPVSDSAAGALMGLPDTIAAFYHDRSGSLRQKVRGYCAYDNELQARTNTFEQECATWANLLDAPVLVTVPYAQRDGVTGRIFVTKTRGIFTHSDVNFLTQVSSAMLTVVENMSLVEELISKAAEHERMTVSRDLHDTTIQPYIGLKLALDGLHREAGTDHPLARRIAELIEMTEMTVRDLRYYATMLKGPAPIPGQFLVSAVKKQAERLKRFYGTNVEVEYYLSPQLKGRLAAEAYQIISEALSNVLRHTDAKNAFVYILCEESSLLLKVGNEAGSEASAVKEFNPRSIDERARGLGGTTLVERDVAGYTVLNVTIPFPA